jgi:hypothetical protein
VWAKSVVQCLARSTSNEAQLWEPTAPHQQIDSNSLLHVREGVLNVCIPDDSNVCACCQIQVVHPSRTMKHVT